MSDEMIHLINQARAQAKRDQWKRFISGKVVVRILLLTIILGAGFAGFRSYNKSQQQKFSEILHQSLINQQIGEIEKAKENLKTIYEAQSAPSGVKSLASLRYAALLLEEGKKSEAAKIYAEVNDCNSCDDYVKDLAGLLAVKVWMSDEAEVKKEDLSARIEKIENASKLLRHHIAEQRAFLEMQKNNLEKSYQIFESISKSPEGSQALKSRANDGLKIVVSKGFEPKVEVKTAEKSEEIK
jgi:hypothetical protein